MKRKSMYIIISIAALILLGGIITVVMRVSQSHEKTQSVYKETTVESGNLISGVTESGSVSLGTISQEFELEDTTDSDFTTETSSGGNGNQSANSQMGDSNRSSAAAGTSSSGTTSGLEVEVVYVTSGQSIKEGDPILKITEDSLSSYREELEKSVKSANLAVSEAQLNGKSQKLDAEYTYDTNIANGSVAQQKYDATISSLNSAVTQAQEKLNESAEKIVDYQERIATGETLDSQLAQEQTNYSSLENELQIAQSNLTTKSVAAKKEYEEAMLNYNNASNLKTIDTNGITEDIEEAQKTLKEAQETLDTFNALVGDGTIYAQCSGTIMECGYSEGDTLSANTSIATYADTGAVTMTVSVSQEDINAVAVGDEVEIQMTAYEDEEFKGTVSSIETSSSSGTSTVSYSVTVLFAGDVSKIYADMTGNVTFVTKKVENVLYVSNKAVKKEGTKFYVTRKKEDGSIEKVKITEGFSDGVNVEIQSGLEEGDTVLIEGKVTEE